MLTILIWLAISLRHDLWRLTPTLRFLSLSMLWKGKQCDSSNQVSSMQPFLPHADLQPDMHYLMLSALYVIHLSTHFLIIFFSGYICNLHLCRVICAWRVCVCVCVHVCVVCLPTPCSLGSIMLYLGEKHDKFIPRDPVLRWLCWLHCTLA